MSAEREVRQKRKRAEARLAALLEHGIEADVFPAYQASVAVKGDVVFEAGGGKIEHDDLGFQVDGTSVFDLASMTKALATVSCCMAFAAAGRLPLDRPLSEILGRPVAGGGGITPRRLLSHVSGLPAWRPFHLEVPVLTAGPAARRASILRAARDTRPLAPAGKQTVYSDIGFLQLTALVEHLGGKRLDRVFDELVPAPGLSFRPLEEAKGDRRVTRFVPTEVDAERGLLAGRVNDENAFAMGGVSGHAGLFGTATAVRRFAQTLLDAFHGRASWIPERVVREFWTKQRGPGTYALGWDTPSKTGSSAGTNPPPDAVGHLGFTGTSIWISPAREAVAVLLTNRVWPDRSREAIKTFRPKFHDLVWAMA